MLQDATLRPLPQGEKEKSAARQSIQFPRNTGFTLFENASNARAKSSVVMHSAWAIASASIASSTDIAHSIASIRLVMVLAKVGPAAISPANASACGSTSDGATTRLKKPQRS